MVILKCKMCGDNIEVSTDKTYGSCDSCGSTMTLPKINDDQRANLYNRANHFRRQNEFDKALAIYERMIGEDDSEAEAHWGAALCRFGIEYVVDPASGKRVPTCHRASFSNILQDVDYLAALSHAGDVITKRLYGEEANYIAEVQREILAISQKEEPYDIFICYKETDASGNRTKDSVLAQELYYQLVREGFKVFFARISLEDKLGRAYEPYIFAALNSAKVMLVVGTQLEHFTAVWVKNEWRRYFALMAQDKSRLLVPCYRDMDAYDLPDELSMLQSQDMGKIGFEQDLVRGIRKILVRENVETSKTVEMQPGVTSLLTRAQIFLEDGDWVSADGYCERVLDLDAQCATAYLLKVCAILRVTDPNKLQSVGVNLPKMPLFKRAMQYADAKLLNELQQYERNWHYSRLAYVIDKIGRRKIVAERLEESRKESTYQKAMIALNKENYSEAISYLKKIPQYKDTEAQINKCNQSFLLAQKEYFKRKKEVMSSIAEYNSLNQSIQELECELAQKSDAQQALGLALFGQGKAKKTQLLAEIKSLKTMLAKVRMEQESCHTYESLGIKRSNFDMINWMNVSPIALGWLHTIALKKNGTVVVAGDNAYSRCSVQSWSGIKAIAANNKHTVGLKEGGSVVAVGYNLTSQCNVSDWRNIVAISAGYWHTVGLKKDGAVVAVGKNVEHNGEHIGQCDVDSWRNVVAISAGHEHTVGLKSDGTVLVAGKNDYGQCDVARWVSIVAISAGALHTVGLKSDGTVVVVGSKEDGKCDVDDWCDIIAISAGAYHTVGLKSDGTVVAVGPNRAGESDVGDWRDIIAISAGESLTAGLKSDGTVVAVGRSEEDQCNVADWSDIMIYDN